ncbi:hypothetical protein [Streptacidiphilus rugosus]|uniref:hypothetical protein n=1 Tax=Streptacidiphilus rugosus TaxID=405783 RepID=UPI00056BAE47|nr:hypothetical protein [Streptacidiphilus rugosus]
MRTRIRRAAVSAAAAFAALGLVTATAPQAGAAAAAPQASKNAGRMIGTMWAWEAVPKTVHRGSTLTLTYWYKENTSEWMAPLSWGMGLQRDATPTHYGTWTTSGVVVTWLDPATGRWEKPTLDNANHVFEFVSPAGHWAPRLAPNQFGHLTVRITFTAAAHLGLWRECGGIASYQLYDRYGHPTNDWLMPYQVLRPFTLVR